jgi:hypothetical protein
MRIFVRLHQRALDMAETVPELIDALGLREESVVKLLSGGSGLRSNFEVTPEDFLDQAEADYEFGGNEAVATNHAA